MNSIPVEIDAQALSLGDNPAIKPIITIAQIAVGQLKLIASNWDQIEELLKSEFAGADAISIRQMRISLSKEQKGDLTKSSTELILDALTAPTADLPWEQLQPLKRINDLLKEVSDKKKIAVYPFWINCLKTLLYLTFYCNFLSFCIQQDQSEPPASHSHCRNPFP